MKYKATHEQNREAVLEAEHQAQIEAIMLEDGIVELEHSTEPQIDISEF